MDNASARSLWGDFLDTHLQYAFAKEPKVIALSDEAEAADTLLKEVLTGNKKAISHSLLGLQLRKEPLPKIGDFTILTDSKGKAKCVLRTVAVRLVPFFSIRESYAQLSGISSLDHWKSLHWEYFERELQPYGRKPVHSMVVVCEIYDKVFER